MVGLKAVESPFGYEIIASRKADEKEIALDLLDGNAGDRGDLFDGQPFDVPATNDISGQSQERFVVHDAIDLLLGRSGVQQVFTNVVGQLSFRHTTRSTSGGGRLLEVSHNVGQVADPTNGNQSLSGSVVRPDSIR